MCYEFWHQERTRAEEAHPKRETLKLIQKGTTAPKPKTEATESGRRRERDVEPALV